MTYPPDGDRHRPEPTTPSPAPAHQGPSGRPTPAPPFGVRRGMAITAIALVALLVIAGGLLAAWLLRDGERDGAGDPVAAVNSFLTAVYQQQDAAGASAQVCSEARDQAAMETKIASIREYQDTHADPRFVWDAPEVVDESDELAIVSVKLTVITGDEKTADQTLHVTVLDKQARGWWVCDVDSVPDGGPDGGPDGDPEGEPEGE